MRCVAAARSGRRGIILEFVRSRRVSAPRCVSLNGFVLPLLLLSRHAETTTLLSAASETRKSLATFTGINRRRFVRNSKVN